MRVLFIDIDTLRPDHMGCYGYNRNTTPCMDKIADDSMVFDNYYTPNAPCLPSRACLVSGQYGIHHGCVGHGGTCGDMWLDGEPRGFRNALSANNLFGCFRKSGLHTASVSTFPERHSAYWFNTGFAETYDVGKGGGEIADEVTPIALDWLARNGDKDNWLLHVHYWDPHTPYRAPAEFGNPFKDEPLPDDWITEDIFKEHLTHCGPHSAREISMWNDDTPKEFPRHPGSILTRDAMKDFMDNYDCGVRYADDNVAKLIELIKSQGTYDDMVIIITSDHGENMGELGLYGEHATADHPTCRIPMIIKWPGMSKGRTQGLYLNIDLAPTVQELLNSPISPAWDGESYADVLKSGSGSSREYGVLGQCAHVCQRSVRFDDYLYIRTLHSGYHLFDDEMLFNIKSDPHETENIAAANPQLCARGAKYILDWEYEMMKTSKYSEDPMWRVMREGGPLHARGELGAYVKRLRETGRGDKAEELLRRYPNEKYG